MDSPSFVDELVVFGVGDKACEYWLSSEPRCATLGRIAVDSCLNVQGTGQCYTYNLQVNLRKAPPESVPIDFIPHLLPAAGLNEAVR